MFVVLLSLLSLVSAAPIGNITTWSCTQLNSTSLGVQVTYTKLICNSTLIPNYLAVQNLVVNVVNFSLSNSNVRFVPVMAPSSSNYLAPLDAIAAADGRNLLAGINGGYFWRTDLGPKWFDGVCMGKNYTEAETAPSLLSPNFGTADGEIIADGVLLGSSCDCPGFSRPTSLVINGTSSSIEVRTRGQRSPYGLEFDTITASPNLVTTNASGSFVDIPSGDDNKGNILEHAANTGVGLRALSSGDVAGIIVTTDGYDGCPLSNSTCGTNAYTLAYLFKDLLQATSAMMMDQGGSTTMFVQGQGIVSHAGGGPRNINAGLFLLQE
jgi:Phosphodiester glycosidase